MTAVSLARFKDDASARQEHPLYALTPGTRFCLRTPEVWGYPETRIYGG